MSDSVFNINLRSAFGCYTVKQGVCVCVCGEGGLVELSYLFIYFPSFFIDFRK